MKIPIQTKNDPGDYDQIHNLIFKIKNIPSLMMVKFNRILYCGYR